MQAARANVFVVEDDPSLNQAVGRLLAAAGFHPRLFGSAEALLDEGCASDADCFVLDVHLPAMSAFALHDRLAREGVRAPIIIVTAHDDEMHRARALEIGAVAYLPKPFSSTSLIDAVVRALHPSST